ncbi:MAG: hypothetical protein LAQ69_47820 [Acidobacteriia bacterium]|nr:hypothetical protein [Terriglobia bacterium]
MLQLFSYRRLAQEKADADEFLKNMRKVCDWHMPDYRPRLRDGEGLGELRWASENKQHRLLGFFMKGCWYAVVGCIHKQQVYDPADAFNTAKRYKRQIESGAVRTVEYDL